MFHVGDLQVILTIVGAHENIGSHSPSRLSMVDFQSWPDNNDILHLSSRVASLTWENARSVGDTQKEDHGSCCV